MKINHTKFLGEKLKYLYSKQSLNLLVFFILMSNTIYPQWYKQYNQSDDYLSSIHFVDYNNGWVVGDRFGVGALILKTTNGGDDWEDNLTISTNVIFESVYFTNKDTGWVVGGVMLKTTNAGNSWDTISVPINGLMRQIQFVDSDYGWAHGWEDNFRGIILRTIDGGFTWERIDMGEGNSFNGFHFVNHSLGWGVGLGIQKTTDAGLNWETKKDTIGISIYFTDEHNGWSVGQSSFGAFGFIHKTTNGGDTWSSISGWDIPGLYSVMFFDNNIGWAVGTGSSGTIIKTTDGGNSWFHQESGMVNALYSVFIIDSITGWAVGPGAILKTTNGGVTFVEEEEIEDIPTDYTLSQNYPNPLNPSTLIKYQIPELSIVTLKVYDVLGNEIATLVNEEKPVGSYEVDFNSRGLIYQTLPSFPQN